LFSWIGLSRRQRSSPAQINNEKHRIDHLQSEQEDTTFPPELMHSDSLVSLRQNPPMQQQLLSDDLVSIMHLHGAQSNPLSYNKKSRPPVKPVERRQAGSPLLPERNPTSSGAMALIEKNDLPGIVPRRCQLHRFFSREFLLTPIWYVPRIISYFFDRENGSQNTL